MLHPDNNHLMLPPALQKIEGDNRVIAYYSEKNAVVGCAPTHPDVEVVLVKEKSSENLKHSEVYVRHCCMIQCRCEVTKRLTFLFQDMVANSSMLDVPTSDWSYSRYGGFRLKKIASWDIKGHHLCKASFRRQNNTITNETSSEFKLKIQGKHVCCALI